MTAAGFAPGGMAAMFEKMDISTRLNDFGGFPYLRSHPLTVERIGEARARAGIAAAPAPVSVLEHTVAQARARVLMDTRVDALRRWQARDADREGTRRRQAARPDRERARARRLLRDWARADAAFAGALAIARASPNSSARAERAVAADAGAIAARSRRAGAGGRDDQALRRRRLAAEPPARRAGRAHRDARGGARQRDPEGERGGAADLGRGPSRATRSPGARSARPGAGSACRCARSVPRPRRATRSATLLGAVDRLRAGQRLARGGGPVDFIDASVLDSRLRAIEAQRRQIVADQQAR